MLLDVFKDGELVESIELSASKRLYSVGRQPGVSDIVLTHGSISREHATLTVSASGSVVVTDLGSAQGTRLSGKLLPPRKGHTLPPGRSLVFGQSTRIYKLREGCTGFVTSSTDKVSQPATSSEPRVQALQAVLQRGAPDLFARPRPDGFFQAAAVLQCASVASAGCTEAELPAVLAQSKGVIEAVTERGEVLIRVRDGHASSLCVDPSLRFRRAESLPPQLIHAIKFKDWNTARSRGLGGAALPIWFCTTAPNKQAALPSLNGKPEVLVFVESASLAEAGIEVFELVPQDGEAPVESIATSGDEEGMIGAWHIEKAINAKDGSELMSADEAKPMREARVRELAARAEKLAAAAAAKAQKQRERALERERQQVLDAAAQPKEERYNPYLAHHEEGVTAVKKATNRSAAGVCC